MNGTVKDFVRIEPNTKGRDIIVGDLHGKLDHLKALIESLELTSNDRIFLVGDLFDRGITDGSEVIKFIKENNKTSKNPKIHVVMGNHEELFLKDIAYRLGGKYKTRYEERFGPLPKISQKEDEQMWQNTADNGGLWYRDLISTCMSSSSTQTEKDEKDKAQKKIDEVFDYCMQLPLVMHVDGQYTVTHAALPYSLQSLFIMQYLDIPLSKLPKTEDFLWLRAVPEALPKLQDTGLVFVGHSPAEDIGRLVVRKDGYRIINLDVITDMITPTNSALLALVYDQKGNVQRPTEIGAKQLRLVTCQIGEDEKGESEFSYPVTSGFKDRYFWNPTRISPPPKQLGDVYVDAKAKAVKLATDIPAPTHVPPPDKTTMIWGPTTKTEQREKQVLESLAKPLHGSLTTPLQTLETSLEEFISAANKECEEYKAHLVGRPRSAKETAEEYAKQIEDKKKTESHIWRKKYAQVEQIKKDLESIKPLPTMLNELISSDETSKEKLKYIFMYLLTMDGALDALISHKTEKILATPRHELIDLLRPYHHQVHGEAFYEKIKMQQQPIKQELQKLQQLFSPLITPAEEPKPHPAPAAIAPSKR